MARAILLICETMQRALDQLIAEGHLASVDIFFAEQALKGRTDASEEEAIFVAILFAAARLGHLCLTVEEGKVAPLFNPLIPESIWKKCAQGALRTSESRLISRCGNNFYLRKNAAFEAKCAAHLARLAHSSVSEVSFEPVEGLLPEQQEAVELALRSALTLITGGPGTGKTYTAAQLVRAFVRSNPHARVLLAAPTGKAAAHLESSLGGIKAGTLHALLKIRSSRDFAAMPEPLAADLLLIDECSMIDARLFAHLLAAVKEGTRLVLLGDRHQLPPVEAGSFFADLIHCAEGGYPIAVASLTRCMRSDQQEILHFAQLINNGEAVKAIEMLSSGKGEAICYTQAPLDSLEEHFPKPSPQLPDPEELFSQLDAFRILSCVRGGPLGVDTVNQQIAEALERRMREGDTWAVPILITRTDYSIGLHNGETGVLIRGKEYALFRDKEGGFRSVPALLLPPFEYAYCLSVHKSQGSEYKHVLLLVPPGSEVFGREVLYTGATRARYKLDVGGDLEAIQAAISRSSHKNSGLCSRLIES